MQNSTWLLLLYGLPAEGNSARVSLWRKLKKYGAIQLKTSAYVLPDQPEHYERFQWLRSEEHTSELQSRSDLVCRLLLEKKKKRKIINSPDDVLVHVRCERLA